MMKSAMNTLWGRIGMSAVVPQVEIDAQPNLEELVSKLASQGEFAFSGETYMVNNGEGEDLNDALYQEDDGWNFGTYRMLAKPKHTKDGVEVEVRLGVTMHASNEDIQQLRTNFPEGLASIFRKGQAFIDGDSDIFLDNSRTFDLRWTPIKPHVSMKN